MYLKVLEYTPDDLGVIDILEEIYVRNQAWRDLVDLLHRLVPQVQGADSARCICALRVCRWNVWTTWRRVRTSGVKCWI